MATPYRSPFWLPGRHVQTIYPYLFVRRPAVAYRRERLETPDGDFTELDWLDGPADAPLVVLFHGLEGSSRSPYALALMAALGARGWRGVVAHWRGCGGEPNRLARAYHSGDFQEVGWMLGRLRERAGAVPMSAIGVSLGGNALLCWLGREGAAAKAMLRAAASLSAPLDLMASGAALDRGFNRVYCRNFLRSLIPKALEKERRFPKIYDAERLKRVSTIREFDDLVTAPLHGFRDVTDYWTRASSKPWLKGVEVPTLVINATNDPFVPGTSLPGPSEAAPAVVLEQPAAGGHVGFSSGPFPGSLDWLCARLLDFLSTA